MALRSGDAVGGRRSSVTHSNWFAWFAALALAVPMSAAGVATAQDSSSDQGSSDQGSSEQGSAAEGDAAEGESASGGEAASGGGEATEEAAPEATTLASPTAEGEQSAESTTTDTTAQPADAAAQEAAAEEAQAEREPLAWRNSFFTWTMGGTLNTFVPDAQPTYNPTYYWSFNLAPRWYLDPRTFFFLSQSGSIELTDDDFWHANREFQLSDTIVELRHTIQAEGFIFIPAVRVTVPTSMISQAAQRYLNTGVGLTAVRVIPEAAGLTIALSGSYRHWWSDGIQGLTDMSEYPNRCAGGGGADSCPGYGLVNATERVLTALTVNVTPVSGLTLTFQGVYVGDYVPTLAPASLPASEVVTAQAGGNVIPARDETRWRHFTYFTLAVAYDILPWFNLSLGVANSSVLAPLFNDDGSVRSPFNPDTNWYLSASFQLDGIYEAIVGGEDDGLTPEQRQRRRQGLSRRTGVGAVF